MTVQESFDRYAGRRIEAVRQLISRSGILIGWELREDISSEHRRMAQPVLMNATLLQHAIDTLTASIFLMREGFRLQPGLLLRPVVETLGYVVHLELHPADLGKFKAGKLNGKTALRNGMSLAPNLQRFWGLLSNHYSHVGDSYRERHLTTDYTETDEVLRLNLDLLSSTTFLSAVVTEYAMFAMKIQEPWFWTELSAGRLRFSLAAEAQTWCTENLPGDVFPNR